MSDIDENSDSDSKSENESENNYNETEFQETKENIKKKILEALNVNNKDNDGKNINIVLNMKGSNSTIYNNDRDKNLLDDVLYISNKNDYEDNSDNSDNDDNDDNDEMMKTQKMKAMMNIKIKNLLKIIYNLNIIKLKIY